MLKAALAGGRRSRRSRHRICFPGAAQHGAKRNDALQTRDRYKLGATASELQRRVRDGPGSAVHRYASLRAAPHPGNKEIHRPRNPDTALSSASACADDDNYPTFSPTKSVSSFRVISGANQMNSGASIRNDSANNGSPAAMEYAVAIQPMIIGASDAAASPKVNEAPTAVPRIWVGKSSAVYPRPVPKLPVIKKFVARPTQNRLEGSSMWPMITSSAA